jgi:hypothetical protein
MAQCQTVAPLQPFSALPNREHPIGPSVMLTRTPEWFREEATFARAVFGSSTESLKAEAALVHSFDAEGSGDPDPNSPGQTKDATSIDSVRKAILALWLARPSALTIDVVMTRVPARDGTLHHAEKFPAFVALPAYEHTALTVEDLKKADSLATALSGVKRSTAVWTAHRFLALTLAERGTDWDIRLLCAWVGIEALFGPEDRKDVQKTMCRRIARFLNPTDDDEGRKAYTFAFDNYEKRCEVAHGARVGHTTPEGREQSVRDAEAILRSSLLHTLEDATALAALCSPDRDAYLHDLAKGFAPPTAFGKPTGPKHSEVT